MNEQDKVYKISTIGDSLTEGNAREAVIGDEELFIPGIYQYWLHKYLKGKGIKATVKNYGIGGQIIDEIWGRILNTVPADYLVVMGGTNDVWRYADLDEEIGEDIWENMEEKFLTYIPQLLENSPDLRIVLCSIPPFGTNPHLPKNAHKTTDFLNGKIQEFIENHPEFNIIFCDVNKAMSISPQERIMNPKLAIEDGVHFTPEGNKVCGETIAQCIANHIKD